MTSYRRDVLMVDGKPRSTNRRVKRLRGVAQASTVPQLDIAGSELRERSPKIARPMTPETRSELAQLARDPLLNFEPRLAAKLTQAQAAQLIPKLRKAAKTRANIAQQNQRQKRATKA